MLHFLSSVSIPHGIAEPQASMYSFSQSESRGLSGFMRRAIGSSFGSRTTSMCSISMISFVQHRPQSLQGDSVIHNSLKVPLASFLNRTGSHCSNCFPITQRVKCVVSESFCDYTEFYYGQTKTKKRSSEKPLRPSSGYDCRTRNYSTSMEDVESKG